MAQIPVTIAVSPSGTTLLAAQQVTNTAATVVFNEVVTLGDSGSGNVGSVLASGAQLVEPGGVNTQPVTGTFFPATQTVAGTVAISAFPATQTVTGTVAVACEGSLAATAPLQAAYMGALAATSYPTAVTTGQLVGMMADKAGRPAVVLNAPRDLVGVYTNGTFTATAATGIITAAASSFYDITTVIITNPMTTQAALTLSDGSNSYLLNLAATGGIAENPATPFPMSTTAATWVANLSAAGTVSVILLFVKNK